VSCFCLVQSTRIRIALYTQIALIDTPTSDHIMRRITNEIPIHVKFNLAKYVFMFIIKGKDSFRAICEVFPTFPLCFKLCQVLVFISTVRAQVGPTQKTINGYFLLLCYTCIIKEKEQIRVGSGWRDMSIRGLW